MDRFIAIDTTSGIDRMPSQWWNNRIPPAPQPEQDYHGPFLGDPVRVIKGRQSLMVDP